MGGERETKICKTCYEQIDARARKCRHCRSRQGRGHVPLGRRRGTTEKPKTCKACYRRIDGRARKCPSCRSPQTRMHMLGLNPKFVVAIIPLIPILCAISGGRNAWLLLRIEQVPPNHSDKIRIQRSEMQFAQEDGDEIIILSGRARNDGKTRLWVITVDAAFCDGDGALTDVADVDFFAGAVMRPGEERAFEDRITRRLPKGSYGRHEVRVQYVIEWQE